MGRDGAERNGMGRDGAERNGTERDGTERNGIVPGGLHDDSRVNGPEESMEKFVKAADLNNEVHAQLVDAELEKRGIPHLVRSYHETAFDGLFQGQLGWGYIEGPESLKEEISRIVSDLALDVEPAEEE